MRSGTLGDLINPWGVDDVPHDRRRSSRARPRSRRRTASGSTSAPTVRPPASDRTHGAEGVIPLPLWIVLFLSAAIIFVFMLFFADSGEHAVVQATMMGGVAVVITSTLLLLWFLDNPYHAGVGGLPPTAMERTLELLDQAGDARRLAARRAALRRAGRGHLTSRTTADRGVGSTGSTSLSTLLLTLAAVATAWATYQAAHWRSEQGLAGNRSTAARVEANRAPASPTARSRSTSARSSSGSTRTRRVTRSSRRSTSAASGPSSARRSTPGSRRSRSRTRRRR